MDTHDANTGQGMAKPKIAVVVQGEMQGGGVTSVARFLLDAVHASGGYSAELVLLAQSARDPHSTQIIRPASWRRGAQVTQTTWRGIPAHIVGANAVELEFQRYMPRHRLTQLLNHFDLVQVVAGGPALAYATRDVLPPVCLFLATRMQRERASGLRNTPLPRRLYLQAMLAAVSRVEVAAVRQCDHIFAETDYPRRLIAPYIDANRITVDTVGVDTAAYHPLPEDARTDDYILAVGRLADRRKNIVLLLEAFARVRQRHHVRLVLAGKSPPPPSFWERAAQLGMTDSIETHIDISPESLVRLYQHAAAFALSSDEEGLGVVLLEAMACATPVVSTRCGGPESVVTDEVGFLVPVGDADALAGRLGWLLDNPQARRAMGIAGRAMVERQFANAVVARKYLDVYARLLTR